MKVLAAAILAACLCGAAWAQSLGPLVTDDPVSWRGSLIRLGDSEAQVRRIAGKQPDRAVILYQAENYPVGEQWMFIGGPADRRVLWVELIRGRVARVWIESVSERR